jgi:hypothetical protein
MRITPHKNGLLEVPKRSKRNTQGFFSIPRPLLPVKHRRALDFFLQLQDTVQQGLRRGAEEDTSDIFTADRGLQRVYRPWGLNALKQALNAQILIHIGPEWGVGSGEW